LTAGAVIGGQVDQYRALSVSNTGIANYRFDDNANNSLITLDNYAVTGTGQGAQMNWRFGTGRALGGSAATIAVTTTADWATVGNRSARMVIQTMQAGSSVTGLTLEGATATVANLVATGNVTLGDATGDTVTVNGVTTFVAAPNAPTAAVDTNTTQVATTAFVIGQASAAGDGNPAMNGTAARGTSTHYARADHVHPTDTSRAPLASPALTGTPTAPTPATSDNSTKIATTAFVKNQNSASLAMAYAAALCF
jgi:hypothetical protein